MTLNVIPYPYRGGPACGLEVEVWPETQRLWVPHPLWVESLGSYDTTPNLEVVGDLEMGEILHDGAKARGRDVHGSRIVVEWIAGCYIAKHRALRLDWIDLQSLQVAHACPEDVRAFHLLALFLLAERALAVGDADFFGRPSDRVYAVVLNHFHEDGCLVQRAREFHRRRIARLSGRGDGQ